MDNNVRSLRDPIQVRMARAAVGLKQADLAACVGVSKQTIKRVEAMSHSGFNGTSHQTVHRIANLFHQMGVRFTSGEDPKDDTDLFGVLFSWDHSHSNLSDFVESVIADYSADPTDLD